MKGFDSHLYRVNAVESLKGHNDDLPVILLQSPHKVCVVLSLLALAGFIGGIFCIKFNLTVLGMGIVLPQPLDQINIYSAQANGVAEMLVQEGENIKKGHTIAIIHGDASIKLRNAVKRREILNIQKKITEQRLEIFKSGSCKEYLSIVSSLSKQFNDASYFLTKLSQFNLNKSKLKREYFSPAMRLQDEQYRLEVQSHLYENKQQVLALWFNYFNLREQYKKLIQADILQLHLLDLEIAELHQQLQAEQIKSPTSGAVISVHVKNGQRIEQDTPLITIDMKARANVSEVYASFPLSANIESGMGYLVTLTSMSDQQLGQGTLCVLSNYPTSNAQFHNLGIHEEIISMLVNGPSRLGKVKLKSNSKFKLAKGTIVKVQAISHHCTIVDMFRRVCA